MKMQVMSWSRFTSQSPQFTSLTNTTQLSSEQSMAQRLPIKKLKSAPTSALPQALPHFSFRFEPHAKPINCTTLPITNTILSDKAHPLYLPIRRRIDALSHHHLHWAVRCPSALSRKRTIRMWAVKRIREAFLAELKHHGFDRHGATSNPSESQVPVLGHPSMPSQLTGALAIHVRESTLTAPISEIREGCSHLLRKVLKEHAKNRDNFQHSRPSTQFKRP